MLIFIKFSKFCFISISNNAKLISLSESIAFGNYICHWTLKVMSPILILLYKILNFTILIRNKNSYMDSRTCKVQKELTILTTQYDSILM